MSRLSTPLLLIALLLSWSATPAFAQAGGDEAETKPTEEPTAEGVKEGEAKEGGEEGKEKPKRRITHPLGNFIEVTVYHRNLSEFVGWIREKARVELYDRKARKYVQLKDTAASRELDGAGIRLYYADGMQGFFFIKYDDITEVDVVRRITDEEEELWEEELARQLEEKRRILEERLKAEREAAEAEAARKAEEGTPEKEETVEVPSELRRGYRLLDEFPPPEWGEDKYKQLRKIQITRTRKLTPAELEFVDSYPYDWKPAYEHSLEASKK